MKRHKNDAADAETICEAELRLTMRFVQVNTDDTQGAAMLFREQWFTIGQPTQAINALRTHLGEAGEIMPQRAANASKLIASVEEPECNQPADAILTLKVLFAALVQLEATITKLDS